MTRSQVKPFFLESSAGRIFVLVRTPKEARRCVLFIPPFAEEMNKSRRQFTITALALVDRGFAVLMPDLIGTGDSEGDFSDANWADWKSDVSLAMRWIENNGFLLDSVVAARLGCALVAESIAEGGHNVRQSVFWQPVESGRQFMTQFLRLRVAASMMEGGDQETVDRLKQRLENEEALEVAGYKLTSELWRSIESVNLPSVISTVLGEVALFEVGRTSTGDLSPVGKRLIAGASNSGVSIVGEKVIGDPFWSATEIVVNEQLMHRTVECITGETP